MMRLVRITGSGLRAYWNTMSKGSKKESSTYSSTKVKEHFHKADKNKSGHIDHHGLQEMLHGMDNFDSFLAREISHSISTSEGGKVTLDKLQSIINSVVPHSPVIDPLTHDKIFKVPESLAGEWKNELESTMIIYSTSNICGQFNGWYCSKVGEAVYKYQLVGRYDVDGSDSAGTLGWTVQWKNSIGNSFSNTAWSGQRYVSENGQPLIYTTWLLTKQKALDDNWESTLTGKDQFTKQV